MTFSDDGSLPPDGPSHLSDPPVPPPPHPEEEAHFASVSPQPEPGLALQDTTPFKDFIELWRNPRGLFLYFSRRGPMGTWVALKAIVGLCFLSWFTNFLTRERQISYALRELAPYFDRIADFARHLPFFLNLGIDPNTPDMRAQAARMVVGLLQISFILAPFLSMFSLLLTASTAWVCLPIVGVRERHFSKIFIAGVYSNWFVLLYAIPLLGPTLAWLASIVYFTLAVKWIHKIGFFRSFLALYVLGWVLVVLTLVVFGVILSVLPGLLKQG